MVKKKRKIKVPLSQCNGFDKLKLAGDIESINFYETNKHGRNLLIDIFVTKDKKYFCRIFDITEGYIELDFYEYKKTHANPTLFDDFFII